MVRSKLVRLTLTSAGGEMPVSHSELQRRPSVRIRRDGVSYGGMPRPAWSTQLSDRLNGHVLLIAIPSEAAESDARTALLLGEQTR